MFTWIILAVLVVVVLWVVGLFNGLTRKNNAVKNAWSDIDVQLKKRFDLVPNLVEVVKGYKNYEAGVLENVTKARAMVGNAGNADGQSQSSPSAKRAEAENALSGALKTLFAVAENYPDLKASTNFMQLQGEISSIENDLQSARRYYNATVREFNNSLQVFPANLVAGTIGFGPREFFGADEKEKENVKVAL